MKNRSDCSCYVLVWMVLMFLVVMFLFGIFKPYKTLQTSHPQQQQQHQPQAPMMSTSYKRRILSGIPKEYTPVGYLQQLGDNNVYPLYGRASRTNVSRWNYHTVTDRLSNIPLPIQSMDGRDCTLDIGCNELYDGDQVQIKGLTGVFTVTMYHMDFRREGGF